MVRNKTSMFLSEIKIFCCTLFEILYVLKEVNIGEGKKGRRKRQGAPPFFFERKSKWAVPLFSNEIFRFPMTEKLAKQAHHFVKKGLTGYDVCYAALAKEPKGVRLTFEEKAHTCFIKEHISHNLTKSLPKNWM